MGTAFFIKEVLPGISVTCFKESDFLSDALLLMPHYYRALQTNTTYLAGLAIFWQWLLYYNEIEFQSSNKDKNVKDVEFGSIYVKN